MWRYGLHRSRSRLTMSAKIPHPPLPRDIAPVSRKNFAPRGHAKTNITAWHGLTSICRPRSEDDLGCQSVIGKLSLPDLWQCYETAVWPDDLTLPYAAADFFALVTFPLVPLPLVTFPLPASSISSDLRWYNSSPSCSKSRSDFLSLVNISSCSSLM